MKPAKLRAGKGGWFTHGAAAAMRLGIITAGGALLGAVAACKSGEASNDSVAYAGLSFPPSTVGMACVGNRIEYSLDGKPMPVDKVLEYVKADCQSHLSKTGRGIDPKPGQGAGFS